MKLAKENFHVEAFTEFPTYMTENSWFGFKLSADDPKGPKQSIAMSWLAYEKTTGATAGTLILGDTKLRTDEELVANFGLSSAGGVQEAESQQMIEDIMNRRQAIATGAPSPGAWDPMMAATGGMDQMIPSPMSPMKSPMSSMTSTASSTTTSSRAPPVVGSGSILSTRGWSPMLNDSFIMGGVHSGHQFHVALNNEETGLFGRTSNAGLGGRDNWRLFMRANPRMLWDSERGVPRVLMREFICLQASGYQPNFEKQELIFGSKKDGTSDKAIFRVYLKALREVGFHDAAHSKDKIVSAVAEFLFGDKEALKGAL